MASKPVVQLALYDSFDLFSLEARESGTYTQLLEIRGNAILSTVFVESLDPGSTVKVNYWDFTVGVNHGERNDLTSHDLISSTGSDRIVVPRIHNRVFCEVVVTGRVRFSVYATVVTDFPNNGDAFSGTAKALASVTDAVSSLQDEEILTATVPSGLNWNIWSLKLSTRAGGKFRCLLDGEQVASGRTGPASENVVFSFSPLLPVSEGQTIELYYKQTFGPLGQEIEAYLQGTQA